MVGWRDGSSNGLAVFPEVFPADVEDVEVEVDTGKLLLLLLEEVVVEETGRDIALCNIGFVEEVEVEVAVVELVDELDDVELADFTTR